MKVVIAPDKFKGTLSSASAADTIYRAISDLALPAVECKKFAIADGGDGSLALLSGSMPIVECTARDALGREKKCRYAFDGERVVIESAEVIGLAELTDEERSPLTATSAGLGIVIADAARRGATRIDIALGGVATCDCGVNMLRELGIGFYDTSNNPINPSVTDFCKITHIADTVARESLGKITFRALCDVRNPLLGPEGAASVYAPQKGATPEQVEQIERSAAHLVALVGTNTHLASGSGTAGGLGWAMREFLGAEIVSGAEYIAEKCGLEEAIAEAELVITGEGRIDNQTEQGKVVSHIRLLCQRHSKPCVVYCGEALTPLPHCYALTDHFTRKEALGNAESLLYSLVNQTVGSYLK